MKLKEFRRVATRYDKLADRFLAFVHLACIRILVRRLGEHAEGNYVLGFLP